MFGNVYGLDLGSYEIKVYDKKSDTIWQEKDVIAIANEKQIFSVNGFCGMLSVLFTSRRYCLAFGRCNAQLCM